MGFYFRRSSSFGPFCFNFSKSGVGASVGVKGARLTLTPKGKTYITVGHGGFYYRKNLSPANVRPADVSPPQVVESQSPLDEIKTADVEELLESSKGELVESLNKRAQMFNPAVIPFVLSGICSALGLVHLLSGASPSGQFSVPDTSTLTDATRQANRMDEYALLLAHYGQPSTVAVTQAGKVVLRTAFYDGAHLAISLVPVGCVDAYVYYAAHKDDVAPKRTAKRLNGFNHVPSPTSPTCLPPADNASTVVAYRDTISSSPIDAATAERYLSGMNAKSATPPVVNVTETGSTAKLAMKGAPTLSGVGYNEQTLKSEQVRLTDSEAAGRKEEVVGSEFLGGALLLLVPAVFVHRKNREKRTTQLVYDLSEAASVQQHVLDEALEQLTTSRAIWRVDSQAAISDWKRNAGAAYNVKREQISVKRAVPPQVESNVVPVCIDLGKLRLFFLPDQVLYWQTGNVRFNRVQRHNVWSWFNSLHRGSGPNVRLPASRFHMALRQERWRARPAL